MRLQASKITLASAYMLYHLHITWSQFQRVKQSLRGRVLIEESVLPQHWSLVLIVGETMIDYQTEDYRVFTSS